ncbi:MAG: hypothetical protein IKB07_08340 [Lachnospiraceae bacterium]|nr:hypothetical protein [Lachnospiraceae bacterium]
MAYSKDLYNERKKNGLCVKCGKENDTSGVRCSECKEKGNKNSRRGYSYYISIGICPRCRKEKLYGDERACLLCNADRYKRDLKRDRERYNEIHRKSSKKIYHESSAKGICTRCNKRKAAEGQKRCKMCIEKVNEYRRKKSTGVPRRLRPDFGMCYLCGEAVMKDQRVCASCHEKITEANRRQDRSGRPDFIFGKKMFDWEARKEKVG